MSGDNGQAGQEKEREKEGEKGEEKGGEKETGVEQGAALADLPPEEVVNGSQEGETGIGPDSGSDNDDELEGAGSEGPQEFDQMDTPVRVLNPLLSVSAPPVLKKRPHMRKKRRKDFIVRRSARETPSPLSSSSKRRSFVIPPLDISKTGIASDSPNECANASC